MLLHYKRDLTVTKAEKKQRQRRQSKNGEMEKGEGRRVIADLKKRSAYVVGTVRNIEIS